MHANHKNEHCFGVALQLYSGRFRYQSSSTGRKDNHCRETNQGGAGAPCDFMAMEGAGLGLAILSEVRTIAQSMKDKVVCYKQGGELFKKVSSDLARVTKFADAISAILETSPGALPEEILVLFVETMGALKDTISSVDSTSERFRSLDFSGSSSDGMMQAVANKARRFLKAKGLDKILKDMENETTNVATTLQLQLSQLCTSLKTDKMEGNVRAMFEDNHIPVETFHHGFNAPPLSGKARFDFESHDGHGYFFAPEGTLRSLVLNSTSPSQVTVARGAPFSVHGVSGMAGVGKTTALVGLAHDPTIQSHFDGGILYMSLGAVATVEHVASSLGQIMRLTGAISRADAVESASSLAIAVSIAADWFNGQRILFLVDDIWPTSSRLQGFLPDLLKLLQGSPESRMALSTRSRTIAVETGSYVDFAARDPQGSVALGIFLSHAGVPGTQCTDCRSDTVRGILDRCGGLPMALAVTGGAVALRIGLGLEFEIACQMYLKLLVEELNLGASLLDSAISLSLSSLEEEAEADGKGRHRYTFREMYTSLCVLRHQQFAPVPVLSRMWDTTESSALDICLKYSSISLAKMTTQVRKNGRKELGLHIHDLQLNYCRTSSKNTGTSTEWHRRLLEGHLPLDGIAVNEKCDTLGLNMLEYTPRSWWRDDICNSAYLRRNVCRHLCGGGLLLELGSLVLSLLWINAQAHTGGIFGLKTDFETLEKALVEKGNCSDKVLCSIRSVPRALERSSASIRKGYRVLSFMLLCDLFSVSKTNEFLHRFLEIVKAATPRPYLVPTVSFYRPPGDGLKATIDLYKGAPKNPIFSCVDFSKCDQHLVAGVGHYVTVLDVDTGDQLRCFKGHESTVSAVMFNSDASNIVSSSTDRIFVWAWRSESAAVVVRGSFHVAAGFHLSRDQSTLFSGSDDGRIRMWDCCSGTLVQTLEKSAITSAMCTAPTGDLFAIGLIDGSISVMDGISRRTVFESLSDIGIVYCLQFSPDGRFLAASRFGKVVIWNTTNWAIVCKRRTEQAATRILFHPNGKVVLLGCGYEVLVWKFINGRYSGPRILTHTCTSRVSGFSFRKDGTEILVGTNDGVVRIFVFDMILGIADFGAAMNRSVADFVLSGNGARVAVLTFDRSITVYNARDGVKIASYRAPKVDSICALSPDGEEIAAVTVSGKVRVWRAAHPYGTEFQLDVTLGQYNRAGYGLSFSPDGQKLLVHNVQETSTIGIFDLRRRTRVDGLYVRRYIGTGNKSLLRASFSSDQRYIVCGVFSGSTKEPFEVHLGTTIWATDSKKIVYDSTKRSIQSMSVANARTVIRSCGQRANRLWPFFLKHDFTSDCPSQCSCCSKKLNVDTILNFVPYSTGIRTAMYCEDTYVAIRGGRIGVFKLEF